MKTRTGTPATTKARTITNMAMPVLAPPLGQERPRAGTPRYLLASAIFLLITALSPAQPLHPTESQVKAAYLYNFGKFVRWQTSPTVSPESLQICILGKDPFGAVLDSTVSGESIDARKIAVVRIAKPQDAARCNILYISLSEEGRLASILPAVQRFALLTVSDIPHFAELGGMIEFVAQEGKIRFAVNRMAAEQSHLSLSSELLKVAVKVIGTAAPQVQPPSQPQLRQ